MLQQFVKLSTILNALAKHQFLSILPSLFLSLSLCRAFRFLWVSMFLHANSDNDDMAILTVVTGNIVWSFDANDLKYAIKMELCQNVHKFTFDFHI